MKKLKELHRQRRAIQPQMRKLQIKAQSNLLDTITKKQLDNISEEYYSLSNQIYLQEQTLISETFGEEILKEWNEMKKIENTSFTNSSEIGIKYNSLKIKLSNVTELLNRVNQIGN